MLVLSRRNSESIHIQPAEGLDPRMTVAELFAAGPLVIEVRAVKGRQVRLGIEAPRDLAVIRDELLDRGRKLA